MIRKPFLERLEDRLTPTVSTFLNNGTLFATLSGDGPHTLSVDSVAGLTQVAGDGTVTSFAGVTNLVLTGDGNTVNVIQNNTGINSVIIGGNKADTLFGGGGTNYLDGLGGKDTLYCLGGINVIEAAGKGRDTIFTNFGAAVDASPNDLVVRFFGPGRTPGTPFIGFDPTLNDGVLYISAGNNGSSVVINPGTTPDQVVVTYDLLGTGTFSTQTFNNVKAIAYFGGTGNDFFINNTGVTSAAYGSAGNDVLIGGTGFQLLKGSSGNDTLIARGTHNDVSGNAGADLIIFLTTNKGDILRFDATDTVIGADANVISISP